MEVAMSTYPDWVECHRQHGREIKRFSDRFYLYEYKTVWNKESHKPQKCSGSCLGRITEQGLIASTPRNRMPVPCCPVQVLEYGASTFLTQMSQDIRTLLEQHFPQHWQDLYVMALLRTITPQPFKRIKDHYERSWLSIGYSDVLAGRNAITRLLINVGGMREQMVRFMRSLFGEGRYLLFDGTTITTFSKGIEGAAVGYSSTQSWDPQMNLMYVFRCGNDPAPVFFRTSSGDVRDVALFRQVVMETELKTMVVVADKGFASEENFSFLTKEGMHYIVPLKRSSTKYDRTAFTLPGKTGFPQCFLFNDRPIWCRNEAKDGYRVITYIDGDLRLHEEKDFLRRMLNKQDGYDHGQLVSREPLFGSFVLQTDLTESMEEIYRLYKQRGEIEQSFDHLKNNLEQDNSYMQTREGFETWCFLNHLSMLLVYRIYNILKKAGLIETYSTRDILDLFSGIKKVRIAGEWVNSIVTKKTLKLAGELGFNVET